MAGLMVAGVLIALAMGKDVNWDQMNYHYYLGFSADGSRLAMDLFPASLQSYLNPYAYYPFYWMVSHQWSPKLIVVVLAAIHSLNLAIAYLLAHNLAPERGAKSVLLAVLAALLTLFNPVFMQELGSSFSDITLSALVLGGWVLLLCRGIKGELWAVFWGAFLLGAATGLKLTNGIFVVSSLILLLFVDGGGRRKLTAVLLFGTSSFLGFLCLDGVWAWQLYKVFGNPLFPVFNSLFKSELLTVETLKDYRFLPAGFYELLKRPFEMVLPLRMVHTEPPAPDIRYVSLITIAGINLFIRRRSEGRVLDRGYHAALGVALVSLLFWLLLSGNSRYSLPLAGLSSVVIALGCYRIFTVRARFAFYLLGLLVLTQGVMALIGGQARWGEQEWGSLWYEIEVPESMRREKALYISTDMQSASFLLPSLPEGSALISIAGQNSILPGAPGSKRVEQLIGAAESLRTLLPIDVGFMRSRLSAEARSGQLLGYGLQVDPEQCDHILVRDLKMSTVYVWGQRETSSAGQYFQSCRLRPASLEAVEEFRAKNEFAGNVFSKVEAGCPGLFQPAGTVNFNREGIIGRYYLNTGMYLYLSSTGQVNYINMPEGGDPVEGGTANAWLSGSGYKLSCRKMVADGARSKGF
ncbi:hypothetical protein [Pseudomonas nicosulfuronedens]